MVRQAYGPVVVFPPPPHRQGHWPLLNLCRWHLLSIPLRRLWTRHRVFLVAGVPFLFQTTHLRIASIIQPLVRTLAGLGGGTRNTNTHLTKSLQLRCGSSHPASDYEVLLQWQCPQRATKHALHNVFSICEGGMC